MEIAANIVWGIIASVIALGVLVTIIASIRSELRNNHKRIEGFIERDRELYKEMGHDELDVHTRLIDTYGQKYMPRKSIPMSRALFWKIKHLEERVDALEKATLS